MIHYCDVILFYPYPVGDGYRFRCFDGKEWSDCDKNGRPK